MSRGLAAWLVALATLMPPSQLPPPAAHLWVSPSGDDREDGVSTATAFRTLARALRQATPGTTVHLVPGTYGESVRSSLRGAKGDAIVIRGEGGRPRLDGGGTLRWGLYLEDSRSVTVENLEITGYTDIGLVVVGSTGVTLRDLSVHDNGFAPRTRWVEGYGLHLDESAGLLVERNDVFRNGPNPRRPDEVGTGINGFAMRDTVIRRNRSHDNFGGGVLVEDSWNVVVKRNRVYRNDLDVSVDEWWDGGIWVDGGGDIRLLHNRLWDNLGPAIEISDEDCNSPRGYVLRGNLAFDNYWGLFVWNFGSKELPDDDVLRLLRNDFSGNRRQDIRIDAWRYDCR